MTTLTQADAVKDGEWWVASFTLDGRTYGTQARHIDQLQDMVADAASLMAGVEKADFDVTVTAR
ncbi:MAG: hypothetical protein QM705_14750 [Ancrocorticia sp.]